MFRGLYFPYEIYMSNDIAVYKNNVSNRLNEMVTLRVNVIWTTNLPSDITYLEILLIEANKRNIKVILGSGDWYMRLSLADKLDERVLLLKNIYQTLLDKNLTSNLIGFSICDEPGVDSLDILKTYAEKLKVFNIPTATVDNFISFPKITESNVDILSLDCYPFYGKYYPSFKNPIANYIDSCRILGQSKNKCKIMMCQGFQEHYGPARYLADNSIEYQPGSVCVWRAPTIAELKWQCFLPFAFGNNGVIIFTYGIIGPAYQAKLDNPPLNHPDVFTKPVNSGMPESIIRWPNFVGGQHLKEVENIFSKLTSLNNLMSLQSLQLESELPIANNEFGSIANIFKNKKNERFLFVVSGPNSNNTVTVSLPKSSLLIPQYNANVVYGSILFKKVNIPLKSGELAIYRYI